MVAVRPRVVLLDRDGVLNVDRPEGVLRLEDLAIEPSAPTGCALLTQAGFRLLVITNQAGIGRGRLTREALDAIDRRIADAVAAAGGRIDGWYICPHAPDDGCACRKPRPGLIHRAHAEHGFDPSSTWMIGDAVRDAEAAEAAGCRAALVLTGKGRDAARARPDLPAFDDLAAAARMIIAS